MRDDCRIVAELPCSYILSISGCPIKSLPKLFVLLGCIKKRGSFLDQWNVFIGQRNVFLDTQYLLIFILMFKKAKQPKHRLIEISRFSKKHLRYLCLIKTFHKKKLYLETAQKGKHLWKTFLGIKKRFWGHPISFSQNRTKCIVSRKNVPLSQKMLKMQRVLH